MASAGFAGALLNELLFLLCRGARCGYDGLSASRGAGSGSPRAWMLNTEGKGMLPARRSICCPLSAFFLRGVSVLVGLLLPLSTVLAQPIEIPAGGFWMGRDGPEPPGCSPAGTCYYDDELPAHWVNLPTFLISANEVTNAEYAAFLNADANPSEQDIRYTVHMP